MDAERTKIHITYKRLKHATMAGLAPSLVFLRDSLDKSHFSETIDKFESMVSELSQWLIHVKKYMKEGDDMVKVSDIESIIEHPNYIEYMKQKEKEKNG